MILFDCFLGEWPFRDVPNHQADDFIRLLDRCDIDMAVVTSSRAAMYTDMQSANEILLDEIAGLTHRLIPFAAVNPNYAGWQADMAWAKKHCKGITLLPTYHGYKMSDDCSLEVLNTAAQMDIPVQIAMMMDDTRQRRWFEAERMVSLEELIAALQAVPDADVVLCNDKQSCHNQLWPVVKERIGKCLFDFSRQDVFYGSCQKMLETVGADHIAVGAQAPLQVILPQILKLANWELSEPDRLKIENDNAKSFLSI